MEILNFKNLSVNYLSHEFCKIINFVIDNHPRVCDFVVHANLFHVDDWQAVWCQPLFVLGVKQHKRSAVVNYRQDLNKRLVWCSGPRHVSGIKVIGVNFLCSTFQGASLFPHRLYFFCSTLQLWTTLKTLKHSLYKSSQ